MLADGEPNPIDVVRASACPFARLARLEVTEPIRLDGSGVRYPQTLASAFDDFTLHNCTEVLDGVIVPIETTTTVSITRLSRILFSVLTILREHDRANDAALLENIESEDWDFDYSGLRFFILALSPSYPSSNTRHCDSGTTSYLLFQPENSFRRFGISSKHPNRELISQRIRRLFSSRGQVYDDEVTLKLPKIYRYIMRATPAQAPVRWWSIKTSSERW